MKLSNAQITHDLFDDPDEQAKYDHMMGDNILKNFDDASEKKIFRKALEGMGSNYSEILEGTEKHMFFSPTSFNLNSQIGPNETSVPDVLDDMKTTLEAKANLSGNEKANLKTIRNHLTKLRPQMAEQEFVDALACFFYQQRGIFIHSLKLDEHLKVLVNKAKLYRNSNKNIGFEFTDFEKKLANQFNISEQSLDDYADDFTKNLLSRPKVTGGNSINGRIVREAIEDEVINTSMNEQTYIKKLFKPGQNYSIDDIKNRCKFGKFESEVHFAGETDLLIMLPDSKLILSIEIKRRMKSNTSCSQSRSKSRIDFNMKSASRQLKKNAEFISSRHGAILSPDWELVKICAISPSLNSPEKICKNCHRFILTSGILKTPGGLDKWWKETGLSNRTQNLDQKAKDAAYNEFQLIFNRLVCLSSIRVVPDPFHTWKQIQGNNPHHMSAGHTIASSDAQAQYSSGNVDVKDVLNCSHDAYKVLFFNRDQTSLLAADNFFHVLFMCDFGAGNSM